MSAYEADAPPPRELQAVGLSNKLTCQFDSDEHRWWWYTPDGQSGWYCDGEEEWSEECEEEDPKEEEEEKEYGATENNPFPNRVTQHPEYWQELEGWWPHNVEATGAL